MRSLIHQRLLSSLNGFYPSRITIQQNLGEPSAGSGSGQIIDDWRPVNGLNDLPCAESRGVEGGAGRSSERRSTLTTVTQSRVVALSAHYPEITEQMRGVIGTVAYDILAIDHGVLKAGTQLLVEKVTA